ncbi:MAG: alpha/beta hydrolase [Solirubrobacteraceae bacterium]
MGVDERSIEVAGALTFYRHAPAASIPALYLHSVPTSSDDWMELMQAAGGLAPDLPGFGRSGKGADLDYSLNAYVDFVERFLVAVGVERVSLVGHGWGAAIGMIFAQRSPGSVHRVTIIDGIPLLDGFTWPTIPRWLRRPGIGEVLMGSINRWMLARTLRGGCAVPEAWPDARVDAIWDQFDQGTQRAILRLYRSVDGRSLALAGSGLAEIEQPTLIVWGDADPWLDPGFGDTYGRRIPHAVVERVPGAGHWPWLEKPELVGRVAAFVAGAPTG